MSETKFPPGPWKWSGDVDDPVLLCDPPQLDDRGRAIPILEAFNGGPVWDSSAELQVDEDAKQLIAAAPELYAVLADLLEESARCRAGGRLVMPSYIEKRVGPVLKKARGES